MNPIDDTLAVLSDFLGSDPRWVLEIGAGEGDLTDALTRLGHDVMAIDADSAVVSQARDRGRPVDHRSWPTSVPTGFDAVIFVRSLHHHDDLDAALSAAVACLGSNGALFVEDFAIGDMPVGTAEWMLPWVQRARDLGVLKSSPHVVVRQILTTPQRPLAPPDHRVHTAKAMDVAIARQFDRVEHRNAPYLYRYFAASLNDSSVTRGLVREVLSMESAAIQTGDLWPLGRRWFGRRKG